MDIKTASFAAITISFIYCIAAARWYVIPWLRSVARAKALVPLLWVHVARYVALQIYSAQNAGLPVPDGIRDHIAYGDVLTSLLAFASIALLRHRAVIAVPVVLVMSAVGILDLFNSTADGIATNMLAHASGLTWLILNFYVPVLWVTHILILWQLIARRGEPLGENS
jgi:hypothetical protein